MMRLLFGTEQIRGAGYGLAVLLAVASATARAEPPTLKAPARVTMKKGEFVVVKVETTGPAVEFVPLTAGLKLFPSEIVADKKSAVVTSSRVGTHKLLAYSGNADGPSKPVTVEVIVTKDDDDPDVPPTPPVPPQPTDPLVKALKTAFEKEGAADKNERMRALAAVMRKGAEFARDPANTTNQALTAKVSAERVSQVANSLPEVRAEIGRYLAGQFDTGVFTLTDADRSKFATAYTRLADALTEVVK